MRIRWLILFMLLMTSGMAALAQDIPGAPGVKYATLDRDMNDYDLAMTFNICIEDLRVANRLSPYLPRPVPAGTMLILPKGTQPCYDARGHRLRYSDYEGRNLLPLERPELPVYVVQDRDTASAITHRFNRCLIDFELVNGGMGLYTGQELFVPITGLPCYDEATGRRLVYATSPELRVVSPLESIIHYAGNLADLSQELNICMDDLRAVNSPNNAIYSGWVEIFLPPDPLPCYQVYEPSPGETGVSVAHRFNVCVDVLRQTNWAFPATGAQLNNSKLYIPTHELPCYDANGRRLQYYDREGHWLAEPVRSPLKTYIIQEGDTLESLSHAWDSCTPEILAVNPVLGEFSPVRAGGELLIPDVTGCYDTDGRKILHPQDDALPAQQTTGTVRVGIAEKLSLLQISQRENICLPVLLAFNPAIQAYFDKTGYRNQLPYGTEVFLPDGAPPCYSVYRAAANQTVYDLSQRYNVCIEDIFQFNYNLSLTVVTTDGQLFYLPDNLQLCYIDGKRLKYHREGTLLVGKRSDLPVYQVQGSETLYEISKTLDVCIPDLIKMNPSLSTEMLQKGQELFVPNTPPCYDAATGFSLIYTNEIGQPLAKPRVAEGVLYHVEGWEGDTTITSMFNVCYDRVVARNPQVDSGQLTWAKVKNRAVMFVRRAEVLVKGDTLVIPVGVECLNEQHRRILQICYAQPVDFQHDYSEEGLSFDQAGSYCYSLDDPSTLVWYQGKSYLVEGLYENINNNYVLTGWKYDVPSEAIADASRKLLPATGLNRYLRWHVLVPCAPGDRCYRIATGVETKMDYVLYQVQPGDTLNGIARQFGKLPRWIAHANHLQNPNIILAHSTLIIPGVVTIWHFMLVGMVGLVIMVTAVVLYVLMRIVRWRQMRPGKKRKNDAVA